jgi:hypothetical protein
MHNLPFHFLCLLISMLITEYTLTHCINNTLLFSLFHLLALSEDIGNSDKISVFNTTAGQ